MPYYIKETTMRYPKFLQKGGIIGFVAPSFGCNIEPYTTAFENAQKKFTDMGTVWILVRTATQAVASASAIRRRSADRS